ncbi:hypothetical protein CI109_101754 [Kwoniella shandongensis]|uniref:Uncharacterized protein n=1 Tax=Kwoniella shandongensis TaxID=1734106 RepID=A0A5M6C5N6_9TREE|nr:uncharacterized protein CI109_001124 [Kwoniella shandongensis]KAA5530323.1 hypothetical protein CI109_001124 [Kwoniella shandongensis]
MSEDPKPHEYRVPRRKSPTLKQSSPLNPVLNPPFQAESPEGVIVTEREVEELVQELPDVPSTSHLASSSSSRALMSSPKPKPARPIRTYISSSPPKTPLPAVPRPEIRVIPPTGESYPSYSLNAYYEALESEEEEEGKWEDKPEGEEEGVLSEALEEKMREFDIWARKAEASHKYTREEKGKGKARETSPSQTPTRSPRIQSPRPATIVEEWEETQEPEEYSPPFEDFGVDITATTPPGFPSSSSSSKQEAGGSGGSDTTIKGRTLSRTPTPPLTDLSPELVTPHSRFSQAMGLAPAPADFGEGDEDMIRWLKADIVNLKAEKEETMEENRHYHFMLEAMDEYTDQLLTTITASMLHQPLLELCASFQEDNLAQIVRFRTQVGTLARTVGSPPPNTNRMVMNTAMIETFARVLRVMLRDFDPLDNFLFDQPEYLDDYVPPDIMWLFIHTADPSLIVQFREVGQSLLNTCEGSRRAVALKLMLNQLSPNRMETRTGHLAQWQQWARRQRMLYESNGNRLQLDEKRVKHGDLRRLNWKEVEGYVETNQKARREWEEAF